MEEEKKKPTVDELEAMMAEGPIEIQPDGAVKHVDPSKPKVEVLEDVLAEAAEREQCREHAAVVCEPCAYERGQQDERRRCLDAAFNPLSPEENQDAQWGVWLRQEIRTHGVRGFLAIAQSVVRHTQSVIVRRIREPHN